MTVQKVPLRVSKKLDNFTNRAIGRASGHFASYQYVRDVHVLFTSAWQTRKRSAGSRREMSVTIQCDLATAPQTIDLSAKVGDIIVDPLRPSEYTTLLIQALYADRGAVAGARALEIGCGSGVVLAALATLGAVQLCGVDVEPRAVGASARLLADLGHGAVAELFQGDMWLPVAGRRFDLIVANLPHFPTKNGPVGGRLPTWSCGGPDGREFLDEFIDGLTGYLRPGGRALVTHNAFVGIDSSRELAARHGLQLRVVVPSLVYIPADKLRTMTDSIRQEQQGRTLHAYGPYCFGEMSIVEFRRAESHA